MKKKTDEVIDKFYKFFEMDVFDSNNLEHKKIVQKRVNMMMNSSLMVQWLKENIWFNKDEFLTHEVIKFLIDCATSFFDEKDFMKKIDFNSKDWIEALDLRVSRIKKLN
tara:strand:- start:184 stop:510 length:327 start_codon:yes stop_codon:yes gene_type:complete